MDQLTLHEYYRPAEPLTDHEALAHRRRAGHESPSLPQRAGKIYALLLRKIAREEERRRHPLPAAPIRRVGHKRIYNIRVRGLARPTPDYDKLARALLEHARNEAEKAAPIDQNADAA